MKYLLKILLISLLAGGSAWADCPTVATDCLATPVYQTMRAWNGLSGGPWTTATRPASPASGLTGFNTNLGLNETWNGTTWQSSQSSPVSLSGTGIAFNQQLSNSSLPANGSLLRLLLRETAGHAVSVSLGTTIGGSDILSAGFVPASGTLTVDITAFSAGWFSSTLAQQIFITSASWGSASVNAQLDYEVGP